MAFAPDDNYLLLDQDINRFLGRWRLNCISLIQPSETLPIELTRTHTFLIF